MTTATEVLGPALGEGLLMLKPSYDRPPAVGADNPHDLHENHLYQVRPRPVLPPFASGTPAYELHLGLTTGHSSGGDSDIASWQSIIYTPNRISGPIQFVLKLLDSWRLNRDDAVLLLGFDRKDNGFVQAVLAGVANLQGRDVRDRIAHLFHIRQTLSVLFRDLDVENEWLREPHTLLDEQEPLKLLLGGSMEDLLLVKEYVDAASGR